MAHGHILESRTNTQVKILLETQQDHMLKHIYTTWKSRTSQHNLHLLFT